MYASLARLLGDHLSSFGDLVPPFLEAHDTVVAINRMTSLGMRDCKETRMRFCYLASPIEAD
jgi:hypothetical protein